MMPLESMPNSTSSPIHYTPCERRILKMLSDGDRHLASELMSCLNDELSLRSSLSTHIGNLRNKIPPGQYIVCEISYKKTYYRHVILLPQHPSHSAPSPQKTNVESISRESRNGSTG
jgi:hypothetical protein